MRAELWVRDYVQKTNFSGVCGRTCSIQKTTPSRERSISYLIYSCSKAMQDSIFCKSRGVARLLSFVSLKVSNGSRLYAPARENFYAPACNTTYKVFWKERCYLYTLLLQHYVHHIEFAQNRCVGIRTENPPFLRIVHSLARHVRHKCWTW